MEAGVNIEVFHTCFQRWGEYCRMVWVL